MAVFPSREWFEAAVRIANADPESARAGEGWKGDFGVVIEAEPGKLAKPFVVYAKPREGKVEVLKILVDADDLDEFEPVYLARAPYSVWKGLIQGSLDPVEAVLKRRIALQGDVQPLLERMQYKGLAERVMGQVGTEFLDDKK